MTDARLVVAGAVVDPATRRLLLAQRRYPPEVAGLWELPGGKVEAGESPEAALRRELREELDVEVRVGSALAERVALRDDLTLIALRAQIVAGTPRPADHEALRWVDTVGLGEFARDGLLVPADAVWVPELLTELGG
ncbi:(deoxy)nucleoside triphosphate pyrophosphohydrolase [Gordonia insulae]|uniref:8-oxo-dGTP diphosphatase n=1 Tax=Gordonia insulae TaxID=2420509 RepID=A0A3G8JUY9_9ACTN|nr:NUDIX domain-containing protein [Gordonia insulae]AZG48733.1 Putative 8-oxo-dGTP diphosphatase 2 [Gordonia insulae]